MISLRLPMRLENPLNVRQSWQLRARKAHTQRGIVRLALGPKVTRIMPPPYTVTMTRFGPRKLDDDGVVACFKAVRDGIADALHVNDGDANAVTWLTKQAKGPYGVLIEIEVGE